MFPIIKIYEANYRSILLVFVVFTLIATTKPDAESFAACSIDAYSRQSRMFKDSSANDNKAFEQLFVPVETKSCHSSSIARTSTDKLFVVWYGGTREGARDVKIYGTQIGINGEISPVGVLLDRKRLERDVARRIRKLGNPVVYAQNERLWLFVASVSYGGWSGASINYSYSDDQGDTWKPFRRLRTTPLLNISSLVRTPVVPLHRNAFLLPAYCEHSTKYGLALTFDASGKLIRRVKTPIYRNQPALQPSIVPLNAQEALAFLRTPNKKIGVSRTNDGGQKWKSCSDLPLDNPDSSVVAFKLNDDVLALVGNPTSTKRASLCVWLCRVSDPSQWKLAATIENEPNAEFSYPSICSLGATTFLSYTYKRKSIKIVNLSKILAGVDYSVDPNAVEKEKQCL